MKAKIAAKKRKIKSIIITVLIAVLLASIFIANYFFPLKYTFAYFTSKNNVALQGQAFVRFIDVGYGDCAIVQLPDGKNMLIDCGDGSYSNNFNIIKELNSCGITHIDYAICSSVQNEHSGGFADIIDLMGVDKLFCPYVVDEKITEGYYNMRIAAKNCGAEVIFIKYGVQIVAENYFFVFLSPTDWNSELSEYEVMRKNPTTSNINNASAVMWLNIYNTNFMFTSDVLEKIAKKICTSYSVTYPYCPVGDKSVILENCNVLKVADHGHKYALHSPFYQLLTPEYAVISVGDNALDCPHVSVLTEINATSTAYVTQNTGNVYFKVTQTEYSVV